MYHNGVTHSVAHDDMDGIKKILHWITYLPPPPSTTMLLPSPTTQQPKLLPPLSMLKDDKARMVHTQPTKSAYDPRLMLDPPDGGGLFDKGTFDEIMSGWAKTIIAGRARLRGLAVGVLAVETRTVECEIPADPATQDSQAKCVLQAGQVWHTDSAFKTAEAINDFNHEGLPLIILANIRGFSGGQKDMFEMVLKFGAWIVDALQTYTQPVIIYLPPFGELRGGAWAVLDTQINPTCITMLADSNSRGGVLEANGIVEIKFREKDLAAAVKFADLHDTTARMLAKGAIHDEVAWQNTRNYFYNLLCVQSIKMEMAKNYLSACSNTTNLSSSFTIDELEKGCKWVDEHLAETSILIRREINLKEKPSMDYSKRTRFEYFFEQIMEYSNGKEFLQVLEQIKADTLLKQLKLVTGNLEQRERFVAALLERD
uniref:CoA carboxyltransferase C-terminal domain-containing protein n=1 Tax=Meloidogyne javanica TaxID=6303 RepID=A0A915N9U2_MELJA